MEEREHKRYIVAGIATLQSESIKVIGRVVSVGGGGLLIYCDLRDPIGSPVTVAFSLSEAGAGQAVMAQAKIAWLQPGKVGLQFVREPIGLSSLLQYLEKREQSMTLAS